ncbi:ParB/RepB/Spo0J family partition protein (plasmid) [Candidatus Vallotia cooleyia]|nr:ParB/RepB/Spo0J family partition protein [Candidatus Vallotia cooleyia]UDG82632.1 ParB/RepB/Spo0J family partition protein [Candidatus Vallotia cooleyia]
MKSSQLARGFQACPDTISSNKQTTLDRLNAIETLVKQSVHINTLEPNFTTYKHQACHIPDEDTTSPGPNESPAYFAWRTENKYTPGQIIDLSLKSIKPSPFNPRYFYLKSSISELAVNLSKQGQQQAIHVIPDQKIPGTFFVSDGGRRIRALKATNKESVRAIVIDLPIGIESYKLGYDLNVQRDSQTIFDNAIVWQRFLNEKRFHNQRELAEHLGIDESTVAVALGISKLPEFVMLEMMTRSDRFGSNMAYHVARYFSEKGTDCTLRLINKIINDGLSTRQVADIVKGRAIPSEKLKPLRRQRYTQRLEIKVDGETLGDLKSYSDDRLELKLRGLTRNKRDKLLSQIEAILMPKTEDLKSDLNTIDV